ncbi:hypothetical protein ACLQ2R_03635 [Streptosporangium sp. DT93]|uniref:hypothetical protein n=1 Tax=Streptosporangium sp. DT93 TaxID=3393428 RepID=UPI003CF3D9E3
MSAFPPAGHVVRDEVCSSVRAAQALKAALGRCGIGADVSGGYELAVVSVWRGLTVWSDGLTFWWATGQRDAERGRVLYARHTAQEPDQAAQKVAFRYADLRKNRPLSAEAVEVHRADPV